MIALGINTETPALTNLKPSVIIFINDIIDFIHY